MMIRRVLLMLLCAVLPMVAGAQQIKLYTISGTVREAGSESPVGYPTCAVKDSTGRVLNAVAAGPDGKFYVDMKRAGSYTLHVTRVGYEPKDMTVMLAGEAKVKMGDILLTASEQTLDEVEVVGYVPLIEVDDEKLSYNLEQDPETPTSRLIDIIRKIPQLSVDSDGNVLLNGQSDYKILLNGRNSSSMNRNFKDIIESLPASAIKNIEVITNPSIKYDAEGTSGIINIITSRGATIHGYNGSVNGSMSNLNPSGNVYIATQRGKVSTSLSAYVGRYGSLVPNRSTGVTERFTSDTMRYSERISESLYDGLYSGVNFSLSYEIDTMNLITFEVNGSYGTGGGNSHNDNIELTAARDTARVYGTVSESGRYNYDIGGSINYQHTINRKRHTITASYDFGVSPYKGQSMTNYVGESNFNSYDQRNFDFSRAFNSTSQIDYYNPINKVHSIEAGVKHSFMRNHNGTRRERLDKGADEWVPDPYSAGSNIDYDRHILAAYAGYSARLKKWSLRAGGRFEGVWNDVRTTNADGSPAHLTPSFPTVVPYASANYRASDMHSFSLSYTQRVNRPSVYNMNPYRDYSPTSVGYGNPALKTARSHSFSLGYNLMSTAWTLMLRGSADFSRNEISYYSFLDEQSNLLNSTYGNILNRQRYGLNASVSYRIRARLNLSLNGNVGYTILSAPTINQHNEGLNWRANLNIHLELWKWASLYANVGVQNGYVSLGRTDTTITQYHSFGFTQRLVDNKLTLSLSVSDPFVWWNESHYEGHTEQYRTSGYTRSLNTSVRLSASYRFGKHDVEVKQTYRRISED